MGRIRPEYLYADLSNRSTADDDVLVRGEQDDEDDLEEEENDKEDNHRGYSE